MTTRPPYIAVMLLSATALAYEILLMRLFSIIQWHHFAYMIISLALLGYGMSGTLIAIFQDRLLLRYRGLFITATLLCALGTTVCFLFAQAVPFNPEELLWDGHQIFYLLAIFLLLSLPFFLAAGVICLTFRQYGDQAPRIYAMDLLGAGLGGPAIVFLLILVFPRDALTAIGVLGVGAALVGYRELKIRDRLLLGLTAGSAVIILLLGAWGPPLRLSPYKSLVQTLRIGGTRIIEERSGPLGLLSVVESTDIPFRHAPGLSLNASVEPPPQLGVFTDGDNLTAITRFPEDLKQLAYLDGMTSALPYHLRKLKRVLILGAGGGADILQAQFHQVPQIEAVELNHQLADMLRGKFSGFAGNFTKQPGVRLHIGEARGFLAQSKERYDLIQLSLVDAFNASASGLYALNESYLYTVEALKTYISHIKPGGFLALTRWIKIPPRDILKLFVTAIKALEESGIPSPENRLILIRGWQTGTLIVKNGPFASEEIRAVENFCQARSFDLAYTPALTPEQVNRYNLLAEPYFFQGAKALLGTDREGFFNRYKFDLRPASDDRPYFHHFFKWPLLPEILHLRKKGGMPLMEWGYMVLIVTLMLAVLTSVILIILPLAFSRCGKDRSSGNVSRWRVFSYFFAIGLAFLFIEIAFLQKFILFLYHPVVSITTTLSAFLVFAGIGSQASARLARNRPCHRIVLIAVMGIIVLALLYTFALPAFFSALTASPVGVRAICAVFIIAPLGFFMGMPFPMALAELAEHAERLVPWAWGINGCASVISAALATLLAVHLGFRVVILCAVGLYIGAGLTFPGQQKKAG